jgi:lipopolysaccharide transport system ATP-binding protein
VSVVTAGLESTHAAGSVPAAAPRAGEPVVVARHVGKLYRLYERPQDRLKDSLLWRFGKTYGREFWALRDVSFDLSRGEVLGIIGRNGSGKSTLLQILAGVLQPTTGEVQVNGRVAALLELGSGFNPDFTGRENVFLNGSILGLSHAETARRFDEIAEFADIGEFIEQPVKVYSSGMFVRLAFAITTAVDADVLVIDEALAVGDLFFRQKCYRRLTALRERGTAIIFVSHAMGDVEQFCERGLVLDHGHEVFQGTASAAVKHYYLIEQHDRPQIAAGGPDRADTSYSAELADRTATALAADLGWPVPSAFVDLREKTQVDNGWARATRLGVCDSQGRPCRVFEQGALATFFYEFELLHDIEVPVGGVVIQNDKGVHAHGKSTLEYGSVVASHAPKGSLVRFCQEISLELAAGEYSFEVGLATLGGADYARRAAYSHDELSAHVVRLADVPGAGQFAVVLRKAGQPVQLLHHGVANLPGACRVQIHGTGV